jgi:DNA polymerase-3 subunit chi
MGAVFFYHLTQKTLEQTLPVLLEKARGAGWRIVVRGCDPDRMGWLDDRLWQGSKDSFLPHGVQGGPNDALQPILLTTGQTATNTPDCVMAVDGASVSSGEVETMQRVCVLFDGTDTDAVQQARIQWKKLTDAGCSAQYWSEETGRWEMKAEK